MILRSCNLYSNLHYPNRIINMKDSGPSLDDNVVVLFAEMKTRGRNGNDDGIIKHICWKGERDTRSFCMTMMSKQNYVPGCDCICMIGSTWHVECDNANAEREKSLLGLGGKLLFNSCGCR